MSGPVRKSLDKLDSLVEARGDEGLSALRRAVLGGTRAAVGKLRHELVRRGRLSASVLTTMREAARDVLTALEQRARTVDDPNIAREADIMASRPASRNEYWYKEMEARVQSRMRDQRKRAAAGERLVAKWRREIVSKADNGTLTREDLLPWREQYGPTRTIAATRPGLPAPEDPRSAFGRLLDAVEMADAAADISNLPQRAEILLRMHSVLRDLARGVYKDKFGFPPGSSDTADWTEYDGHVYHQPTYNALLVTAEGARLAAEGKADFTYRDALDMANQLYGVGDYILMHLKPDHYVTPVASKLEVNRNRKAMRTQLKRFRALIDDLRRVEA